jgi:hypothetical protein
MRNLWKFVPLVVLVAATWDCGGEPGHRGTPSDPNQQQGNPNAQPENSIVKGKVGDQPSGDKTGKDAHTLEQRGAPDTPAGKK